MADPKVNERAELTDDEMASFQVAFAELDIDDDGHITILELGTLMSFLGIQNADKSEIRDLIEHIALVDLAQFLNLMAAMKKFVYPWKVAVPPGAGEPSLEGRNGIIFTIVKWIVSNFSQPDGWRKIVSTIIAAIMIVGCFASYPLLTGLCCVALGFFLVVMAHCIHFVRCYDWVIYVQPIFDVVYKVIMFCIWIGQAYYYRDAVKSFFTKLKPVHKQKLRGVSSLLPNQTLPKLNF